MRHLRQRLASALFVIPVVLPGLASAAIAPQTNFDLQIFDRTEGRYLPTYQFEGRTYVVGKPGNEYAVSLRNQGGERVMAVTSVDGVNIVSGETASPAQSGYVLSAGQVADINGWRKSMSNIAAFYFTDHSDSYAARTGRPNDVGVIGVAVFRERRVQPPVYPYAPYRSSNDQESRSSSADSWAQSQPGRGNALNDAPSSAPSPAPSQSGSMASGAGNDYAAQRAEKSLGTGHGRIEDSRTRYTDFQRASSTPDQVVTIYYNTYSNLLSMGVPVYRDESRYGYRNPQPRPFPRDPTLGFVPNPPSRSPYAARD